MKYLLIMPVFIATTGKAQTQADYNAAMNKFVRLYNAGKADSIDAMFSDTWSDFRKKKKPTLWNDADHKAELAELGTIKSVKFIGIDKTDPAKVHVYKTVFAKAGTKTTSLTLEHDKGLGTFRLVTSSEGIDALLKKGK